MRELWGEIMDESLKEKLQKLKPILKEKYGIEKFAIFGSVARGENTKNSDIDIAILKIKKRKFSIRQEAKRFLETSLDKRVDLGYFDSMKTYIQNIVKKDFIYV